MNVVIMMGRLTRDPEIRYAKELPVAKYSIAVDRRFKRDGQPTADFFDCTSFGKQAEFVEKYLHKGSKIVVTGNLQNDNYQNRDGNTVYRTVIIVDSVEFAESKAASEERPAGENSAPRSARGSQGSGAQSARAQNARKAPPRQAAQPTNDFASIDDIGADLDEDLPFS